MFYICTQPRIPYYAWHLEVMLNNFKEIGIPDNKIHILLSVSKDSNDKTNHEDVILMYNKLKERFNIPNYLNKFSLLLK